MAPLDSCLRFSGPIVVVLRSCGSELRSSRLMPNDVQSPAEKKTSLLIIKSNVKGLTAAESYLLARGWELYSCVDLKQALTMLIQKKPQYVMISVEHPHKKVRLLPNILGR